MGKLIVIDGLDGSGKSTQAPLVADFIRSKGETVHEISYPNYESQSSALVKMYLNGELAENADDINAYAASSFYAVDRYANFKTDWEKHYLDGHTIIATRYTTSNAVHQMSKLSKHEWTAFLDWLEDYEYVKLGLPRPDKTIFLDMSRSVADKLISSRYQGDETKRDIHESNMAYLVKCRESAIFSAEKLGWGVISCDDGVNPLSVKEITDLILREIL